MVQKSDESEPEESAADDVGQDVVHNVSTDGAGGEEEDENVPLSTATVSSSWELEHESDSSVLEESPSVELSPAAVESAEQPDLHEESEGHSEEKEKKEQEQQGENEQQREIIDENEDSQPGSMDAEDNIPAESRQAPQTVIMEPPTDTASSSSQQKRRFERKNTYARFAARPTTESPVQEDSYSSSATPSGTDDNGPNLRRKTFFPSGKSTKFHSPTTDSPIVDNESGTGTVVYSQRIHQFAPYRSRNNANNSNNKASVSSLSASASESTDGASSASDDVQQDYGAAMTPTVVANEDNARPENNHVPARRRRPFNQMRNRKNPLQQQQQQQQEGDIGTSGMQDELHTEQQGSYGSLSSGQTGPSPLHVAEQQKQQQQLVVGSTTGGLSAELSTAQQPHQKQDELENGNRERRPMSRLVKPRVNGGRRRKPGNKLATENGESLYPNNSYGQSPDMDSGEQQQEQGTGGEVASIQQAAVKLEENVNSATNESGESSSDLTAGKVLTNTPTGKLMPLRPRIKPFNRSKAQGWSAAQAMEDASNVGNGGEETEVKYEESQVEKEEQSNVSVEQKAVNGAVNIRRIPMRRVQPTQAPVVEPEVNEGVGNENNGAQAEVASNQVASPVRGRITMRRPINLPGRKGQDAAVQPEQQQESSSADVVVPVTESVQKIEKLDVRARLRARPRPNILKSSSQAEASNESMAATDENETIVDPPESQEPSRSPLLRKRIRPGVLRKGQGQQHTPPSTAAEEPTAEVDMPSEEQPVPAERPLLRVNRIRKGNGNLARLPLTRNQIKPAQSTPVEEDQPSEESDPEADAPAAPASSLLLRNRQNRLSNANRRGNTRHPANTATATATTESNEDVTSEAPVTVTSSYSRLRVNSKSNLLTRPTYRRPTYVSSTTTTPQPSPAPVEDAAGVESVRTSGSGRFGQKTRFRVPQKSDSAETTSYNNTDEPEKATSTVAAAAEATLSNEEATAVQTDIEKEGQSNQLNEQIPSSITEDYSSSGGRKKVGFVRRKMVRVRQKQQQQQDENHQQQVEEQPEKKEPTESGIDGEAGSIPVSDLSQNSEHVPTEPAAAAYDEQQHQLTSNAQEDDQGTTSPVSASSTPSENEEQDSSTISPDSHQQNIADQPENVKIVPVAKTPSVEPQPATEESNSYDDYDGATNEENDHASNTYDHPEPNNKHTDKAPCTTGPSQHPHPSIGDIDSDSYDLVLNQQVRKTLGTQQYHHDQQESKPYSPNSLEQQKHSAYQSPSFSTPASHQDTHYAYSGGYDQGSDNSYASHHQQQQHNQQYLQQEDYNGYYDHYDENAHKYSSGVSHTRDTTNSNNGFETLELGTPDYDSAHHGVEGAMDQYYWDEEESRVQEKYLKNKSTSSSSPSQSSLESSSSLSQNEGSHNYNEDTNKHPSSSSPVNPSSQPIHTSNQQPTASAADAKAERNKRIRQKLRRPQSAYINSSPDSSSSSSGSSASGDQTSSRAPTTTVPFTPSLQSPRPTYSGQEALLESVHQSAQAIKATENPNSQQLEQFIEQNNNRQQHVATRNRNRVRVKLVTLGTTTAAPVSSSNYNNNEQHQQLQDNINNQHSSENYSAESTPDASSQHNEVKKTASRPQRPARPTSYPTNNKFSFPPFRKSELTLIPSTEAPIEHDQGEEQGASSFYHQATTAGAQRVVFRPATSASSYHYTTTTLPTTTSTTTTTTPATTRKPLRNYNNYNSNDDSSSYNTKSQQSLTSLSTSVGSPGVKSRFKVNALNKTASRLPVHLSSASQETVKQHVAPSIALSTRTSQQHRIKSPQYHRRVPTSTTTTTSTTTSTTTTTEAPVVIRHPAPTTAPSLPVYYAEDDQSQEQPKQTSYYQKKLKPVPTIAQPLEIDYPPAENENIISIRFNADQEDISNEIDQHQTQEDNYVEPKQRYPPYQQHPVSNIRPQQQTTYQFQQQEIPKVPLSYSAVPAPLPPPASKAPPSYDVAPINKYTGSKKGTKHNGRFKVPSKFELEKPHQLSYSNNEDDSSSMKKPYAKPAVYSTSGEPQVPAQPQQQLQRQPEQEVQIQIQQLPVTSSYGANNGDFTTYNQPANYHQQQQQQLGNSQPGMGATVQARPEPEDFEEEEEKEIVVPDIQINVEPPQPQLQQQQQNYLPNGYGNMNEQNNEYVQVTRVPPMQQMYHAVRQQQVYHPEPIVIPPEPANQYQFPPAIRNSPYGPFPSTDHWSGIPSSNSPRLPEYFEQKRLPNHVLPPPQLHIQNNFDNNELRRPHQHMQNNFDNNELRRPQPPPPPTQFSNNGFEQRPQFVVEQRLPPPPRQTSNVRFVDDQQEGNQQQQQGPPESTVIQFGSEFEDDAQEIEQEVRMRPQRPVSEQLEVSANLQEIHPRPHHRLPPPLPMQPQSDLEAHRPIELQNNINNQLPSLPPRSNELNQQQLVRAPVQLPLQEQQQPLGMPPNMLTAPPPPNPVSIEIKDGELVMPQFFDDHAPANNLPPPRVPTQQLNQLPPVQMPPQQQIRVEPIMIPPPVVMIENGGGQQQFQPQQQPILPPMMNSQFTPEQNANFVVQVDGRPHDAPVLPNQPPSGPLMQKPMDRPEPEIKIVPQPVNPNFPNLPAEGRPMMPNVIIRDQHPNQAGLPPPLPPKQQVGAVKFPEMPGFGEHHLSRPGQFGPPPPGQQRPLQYVPFNAPPLPDLKGKRNESEFQFQRPPVLPPPPQAYQNPFKFNSGPPHNNQHFPPQNHHQQQQPQLPPRQVSPIF